MARLRIAIIGYGDSGRGIHARLLREIGEEVSAVVTRSRERSAEAVADWPAAQVFASIEELLGSGPAPDLAVVATPTGLHTEHARALVEAGVPLVVDKPLATTAADARDVVVRAERDQVPLTVFQNRRWDTEQLTLAALLERGELGRVHRFERRWERWRPISKDRWKENAVDDGGGLLLDLGPHLVDSAVQLFGPVRRVYAEVRALHTPADDDVFLALEHESGVLSHLSAGSLVGAPGPRTRVLGAAGAYLVAGFEADPTPFAVLDDGAPADTHGWLLRGEARVAVPVAPGSHADFYRAVVEWVADGGAAPVDPWDAVRTAVVLDAARESATSGRRVVIQP